MRKTHTFCALLSGFEGKRTNFDYPPDIVHGVQMFKLFMFIFHPHDNPEEALYI